MTLGLSNLEHMTSDPTTQLPVVLSAEQQVFGPLILVLIAWPDPVEYICWLIVISGSLVGIRGICILVELCS